jgi:hypothetical protein
MKNRIKIFLIIFLSAIATSVYAQDKGPASPLSMSGWDLESNPKIISNPTQEAGMISYEIEVDSLGDLLSVKALKQTISDELAQKCEAEIRKMKFVKNTTTPVGAPTSKGTITFVFRVN